MKEEPILQDDTAKPEPVKASGVPDTDKKRIMLGTIVGGSMFLGILIAIIVLVSTEEVVPHPGPEPPKPPRKSPYFNPFIVSDVSQEDDRTLLVLIYNNRTQIEKTPEPTPAPARPTIIPIVHNTTENPEPNYIRVIVKSLDEHLMNIKYIDPEWERWIVPDFGHNEDPYSTASKQIIPRMNFHVMPNPQNRFEWRFNGKETDLLPLMTTEDCRLQYFDKYIEFEARIQTDVVFGMGERMESFLLKNDNYSMWNRHYAYDLGADSETGLFSSHPFFMNRLRDKKDFIGVFMRNSNAMLFSMWHTLNNGTFINFKTIGGIIDLYIFHETDPIYIIRKYHSVIGRPYLPPVWAMGLQQARSGYTLQDMKTVIEKHQAERIPIDALWADVDLNDNHKTFTVDSGRFAGLKEFVQKMHDSHEGIDMRFVAIANPGLKKEAGYKYYESALKQKALIQSAAVYDSPFEGRTAAGTTVWVDFFPHSGTLVWAEGLHDLHDQSLMDGIWISENEINQLCNGECGHSTSFADAKSQEPKIPNPFHNTSEFDYLQYRSTLDPLEYATLPMSAYHCCDDFFFKQYYTHNLFGLQVAKATYESLYGIFEDKRFLVASRSSWPGSGQFSSHWLAENFATWDSMLGSIAGILNFNMFGIPHVGAPIGGYYGDASAELLARWFELACFTPLMLSYGASQGSHKEAYAIPEVMEAIKTALHERYSLIRFMYTKMFEAYAWGGPVIHPLFFDFPEDEEVYKRTIVDRTFMWSSTLYVIPALIQGQVRTRAYLPNWRWYDLRTYEMVTDYRSGFVGDYYVFEQPLGYITVLLKGGSIIPYQYMSRLAKVMNVEDLKLIPAQLIIAPDHLGRAAGSMVVDTEGIRPHPDPMSHTYRHYSFTYMNQILRINKLAGFDFHEEYEFDYFWELIILDVFGTHNVDYVCMMDTSMRKKELQFWHAMGSNALLIHDDRMAKMPMFTLESIVWGTNDQHDFCKFEVHLNTVNYEDADRTLLGELATSDPNAYQLKFDLKASILSEQIISMQIAMNDPGRTQWIVPDIVDDVIRKTFLTTRKITESGFRTSPIGTPFAFELADPVDSHEFIFTTRNLPFVYVRNFMHLKFMVNSRHIFGLGERINKFELDDGLYSMWNYDAANEETGLAPGNNMYGMHPFYMVHLHNPKQFAAVFFLNSNPMDIKIKHVGMQTQIDHIFSGGIIDAFFFQRGSVDEVIRSYHYIIGRPVPLPYWAFGYHQSRWGYRDIVHLRDVVAKFEEFNIPLDVVWMDKDYMRNYRTFTVDEKKWYGLAPFVKSLHDKGKYFVAIVDPGIAKDPEFPIYTQGLGKGAYIHTSASNTEPLTGVTWPGYSVWVDFLNPTAVSFWEECLLEFHNKVDFDGLWLDMNEPSNFCDGDCLDGVHYNYYYFPLDVYDDLYYNPTHRALEKGTISMEAVHYGTSTLNNEFNYHALYGFLQSRATARFFMARLHKRPFVISSSTFPGSGKFASHWLGDNYSSWHYMQYSIAGVFNFQMFGIPFVGADICGFSGNATMNLCSRWMQLGAFYPFMRNHNGPNGAPQEPYVDQKLASISRKAIHLRYSLARYMYSEYMHLVFRGGLFVRPVLFDFPDDLNTYSLMDTAFMFGHAIRVTPILQDRTDTINTYFPNLDWYEYPSYKKIMNYNHSATKGQNIDLHSSLDAENINVHIRAGTIFPRQECGDGVQSIMKMQDQQIELVVVPDHYQMAKGSIFYDDEHYESFRNQHLDLEFEMYKNEIKINFASGIETFAYEKKDKEIKVIKLLDAEGYPNIQCAKVYDKKQKTSRKLKVERKDQTYEFTPEGTTPIAIIDISSISWYNTTEC